MARKGKEDKNNKVKEEESKANGAEQTVADQHDSAKEAECTDMIEEMKEKLSAQEDKHLRLFAEFENYKRRTAKERVELIKNAAERLCVELLPVLDDFERAMKATEEQDDIEEIKKGFGLIQSKLVNILSKEGLKPIDSSIGEPLDTEKHEAITQIPAPSEELKGKIIDEVEKGYLLNDKVIRFTKVVMGQS